MNQERSIEEEREALKAMGIEEPQRQPSLEIDPEKINKFTEEARSRTLATFSKEELRNELSNRLLIEEVTSNKETVHSMLVVVESDERGNFQVIGLFSSPERVKKFVGFTVGVFDETNKQKIENYTFTVTDEPFTFTSYTGTTISIFTTPINQPVERKLR